MPVKTVALPLGGLDDHDSVMIDERYVPNLRNVRSDRDRIVTAPGGVLLAPAAISGTDGFGMQTGYFQEPASPGTQTIAHGLGVVPQALLLFTAGPNQLNNVLTNWHFSIGMTDGTTSRSVGVCGVSGFPATTRQYANAALVVVKEDSTTQDLAQWVSWDATNFTLNWTTVNGFSRYVGWMVFGNPAMSAKVMAWNMGAATGAQAVTGVGFQPNLVMHLYSIGGTGDLGVNLTDSAIGFGAMSASGQYAASATSLNAAGSNHFSQQESSSTSAIVMNNVATPTTRFQASFSAFGADGFTVNRTVAPPAAQPIASLCIGGLTHVKVGRVTGTTVDPVPGNSTVSGFGFHPTGLLHTFISDMDGIQQGVDFRIGAADGAHQNGAGYTDGAPTGVGDATGALFGNNGFLIDPSDSPALNQIFSLNSFTSDGLSMNILVSTKGGVGTFGAIAFSLPGSNNAGVIRNYGDLIVGGTTPAEKIVMLTSKSAFVYAPSTPSTGIFGGTSEVYTGTDVQRFSIANGTDSAFGAVAAWSQGTDNIRAYDGTAFSGLITSGTNHAARVVLPFNNRIVSVRPFFGGIDHKTQVRWSVNGTFNDWSGAGSGVLEVVQTSNQALTGGFVLGSRCYLTRAREIIELIATGSLSPVFIPEVRVSGVGCIATHSVAMGDIYAFWLGPDEIYQWDGAQLQAVGGRTYNTITQLVNYENLDQIQGVVYTPDSQYWLVVPPYVFVYDYRRQIWDWDDVRSFEAIGILSVQDLITADLNHSEFVVIGDSAVQTIRVDPDVLTYLDAPIDSYFETKDFLPVTQLGSRGNYSTELAYDKYNTLWRVWFRGRPGERVEVACSTDKGVTYPSVNTQIVTVNAQGVGIYFSDVPWGVIRLRFRSQSGSYYRIFGPIQMEYTDAGVMLP